MCNRLNTSILRCALYCTLALLAVPCFAADSDLLPDKPQPRPATVDKTFLAEVGTMAAAWTADTVSTHYAFAANPDHHEVGWFFTGSRATAEPSAAWAAVDAGAVVAAYEWKKHVHNRYLHPIWHVFMLQRIVAHSEGTAGNVAAASNAAETKPRHDPGR